AKRESVQGHGRRARYGPTPRVRRDEMRLKQLLGVILLLVATATAAAAASQLTDLNVAGNGNVTTVTFRANGTFTHNEYRPTDNLVLVDLAGVAPARFAGVMKDVHLPGVSS